MTFSVVCDLYQWMPGHGENSVTTSFDGSNFCIEIKYDGEAGNQCVKTLCFEHASYHSVGSFPGVGVLEKGFPYDDGEFESGCLKKIEDSLLAHAWEEYWTKANVPSLASSSHYLIFFTSENKVIHVVASDVIVF